MRIAVCNGTAHRPLETFIVFVHNEIEVLHRLNVFVRNEIVVLHRLHVSQHPQDVEIPGSIITFVSVVLDAKIQVVNKLQLTVEVVLRAAAILSLTRDIPISSARSEFPYKERYKSLLNVTPVDIDT